MPLVPFTHELIIWAEAATNICIINEGSSKLPLIDDKFSIMNVIYPFHLKCKILTAVTMTFDAVLFSKYFESIFPSPTPPPTRIFNVEKYSVCVCVCVCVCYSASYSQLLAFT